ncbi:MAG: class I SAM-dependent methyltransferase [Thiopseudomonas sp.]|nr:class I SAM-dependent methyltransferase [Thiopseudomonas sp.]MCK9464976.1 class I SAM-dependent methyltransferase [Thiopseudomonas sp.]
MSNELLNLCKKYKDLPYMQYEQAKVIQDIIIENNFNKILELGFYHGKSSLLIASILSNITNGHLTTLDIESATTRTPNIYKLLKDEKLSHKVTVKVCRRSYTFELMNEIISSSRPKYDLCYFDGGHTLDYTGFGFYLVDKLLNPGGIIIFDDLNWTIEKSQDAQKSKNSYQNYSDDEKKMQAVRVIFEHLVKDSGYECTEIKKLGWGIARKIKIPQ